MSKPLVVFLLMQADERICVQLAFISLDILMLPVAFVASMPVKELLFGSRYRVDTRQEYGHGIIPVVVGWSRPVGNDQELS